MPATKAKQAKTKPTIRRITCAHPECTKRFRTTNSQQKYCSVECGKNHSNSKRPRKVRNRLQDFKSCNFVLGFLVKHIERANTARVIPNDFDSLCELYEVYAKAFKANGYGSKKDFTVSHVHPVKGIEGRTGSMHPCNLVVAPTLANQHHGTQHFGQGHFVARSHILDGMFPVEGRKPSEIVDCLIQYLGEDLCIQVAHACDLKPTTRHKHIAWLNSHIAPSNPDHKKYKITSKVSTAELGQWKRELQDKLPGSDFSLKTEAVTPFAMYWSEIQRMAKHRPELQRIVDLLTEEQARQCGMMHRRDSLEEVPSILFSILHGEAQGAYMPRLRHWAEQQHIHAPVLTNVPAVPHMIDLEDWDSLPL